VSPIGVAEAFEGAPLLAERVGEGDAATVSARARSILETMTDAERVAVLNAHPRIGAATGLSARSAAEQSAGTADAETLRALESLNAEYERTFGFRFVVFVNGRSRAEIVPVLQARLRRTRHEELATGIDEFLAIAHDRLERG
jgi:2-oxo-4-hydroxy-4-carboxy--5-ureidoimidazoline (OHCU) decarboxylase